MRKTLRKKRVRETPGGVQKQCERPYGRNQTGKMEEHLSTDTKILSSRYLSLLLPTLLSTLLLYGCKNREIHYGEPTMREVTQESAYHFSVLIIDGCEYLILELDRNAPHEGFGFFAHRGNCSNPIHRYDSAAWQDFPPSDEPLLLGVPKRMGRTQTQDSVVVGE